MSYLREILHAILAAIGLAEKWPKQHGWLTRKLTPVILGVSVVLTLVLTYRADRANQATKKQNEEHFAKLWQAQSDYARDQAARDARQREIALMAVPRGKRKLARAIGVSYSRGIDEQLPGISDSAAANAWKRIPHR